MSVAFQDWEESDFAASDNAKFAVFDLTTTGLDPRHHRIIEMAALRIGAGAAVTRSFHSLVWIDRRLSSFVSLTTGITDEMLAPEKSIGDVLPQFVEFIGDLPLVSYNVSFNMEFLAMAAARMDLTIDNVPICALQLARKNLPDLADHKLRTVAAHFGIAAARQNRAIDNCRQSLDVFAHLMRS